MDFARRLESTNNFLAFHDSIIKHNLAILGRAHLPEAIYRRHYIAGRRVAASDSCSAGIDAAGGAWIIRPRKLQHLVLIVARLRQIGSSAIGTKK